MKEEFDFESIKNKAIEQLKAGKPLLGKDGAFAPLLESILNVALEGEMDTHFTEEERQMGNRRNGKMQRVRKRKKWPQEFFPTMKSIRSWLRRRTYLRTAPSVIMSVRVRKFRPSPRL